MTDRETMELLRRLHTLHRQLGELNSRLRKGALQIKILKENARKKESELQGKKEEYKEFAIDSKKKENELKTVEEQVERRKTQLAEAKNNKEYSALKDQIEKDNLKIDSLSDIALEAITETEEFEKKVNLLKLEYEEDLKKIVEREKSWESDKKVIEEDIKHYTAVLKEEEQRLNREFHPIYLRVVEGYGGEDAMAAIDMDNYCGHCKQKVPYHFVNEILAGNPVVCPSCGRLLYIPEGYTIK